VLEVIAAPLAACLIITGIHTYLGIHVLMRGVIFVDLALAQIAAMGVAVALIAGLHAGSMGAYLVSLAFTFAGAGVFAVLRFGHRWIPQEAFIGIVYAVGSALTVLLLSQSAVEREEIEQMLVGRLLFVDWPEVWVTLAIYTAVSLLYAILGKRLFEISAAHAGGRAGATRLLDFVFYASFGVVVTTSVKMAGVLLVFSFLIVPAACAMLFFTGTRDRLVAGSGFGTLASGAGIAASALWDLPTGASVVVALGVVFAFCGVAALALRGASWRRGRSLDR
jgi:zinc/manganese transport system permease protein